MIDQSALLALRAAEQARLETALAGSSRTIAPAAQATRRGGGALAAASGHQPDQAPADGAALGALVPAAGSGGDGAAAAAATGQQGDPPAADGAALGALVPAAVPQAEPAAEGGQIVPAAAAGADSSALAPAPAASGEAPSCAKEARAAAEEQHREAERAWRQRLREGLRELKGRDYIRVALKVAAPSLLNPEDDALEALTTDSVKRLHDEFARLQEQAEKGGVQPRALVRAMQQLYLAESCRDASLSLSTETADEEALRQLTERTEEFAPALEAMRTLAVDKAIFAHLADADEEANEEHASEADVDDLDYERELVSRQDSGLVLPDGWRVEWVQVGKRQMKHFIDQDGRRYTSHRQARAALAELEACRAEAERIAAENAASLAAAAAAPDGGPKRVRLRGKVSASSLGEQLFGVGGLEAAFEEALGDALGEVLGPAGGAENGSCGSGAAAKPGAKQTAAPPPEVRPGAMVVLKGLVAKPELNGQQGRLLALHPQTGRWEAQLADRSKVNVRPANFDVVAPRALALAAKGQPKKRPAASPAPGAPASKALAAEGRGRGPADEEMPAAAAAPGAPASKAPAPARRRKQWHEGQAAATSAAGARRGVLEVARASAAVNSGAPVAPKAPRGPRGLGALPEHAVSTGGLQRRRSSQSPLGQARGHTASSLNVDLRRQETDRINRDNERLLERLRKTRPEVPSSKLLRMHSEECGRLLVMSSVSKRLSGGWDEEKSRLGIGDADGESSPPSPILGPQHDRGHHPGSPYARTLRPPAPPPQRRAGSRPSSAGASRPASARCPASARWREHVRRRLQFE
ncbi:unnamed protein product [Prorocentrum cordatum]|uniref:Uncharacterized protein n=1 Tax=Prorocentrum cordatum TaxID=2364126 RepID=A0ABN9R7G3_9DINO|nr:unnamed protein product [Polarella glacialis]